MGTPLNTTPAPFVYAYQIRKMNYHVSEDNKLTPVWATTDPQVIQPADIEDILHTPNTFLLAWQEMGYRPVQEAVSGTILTRYKETVITKPHLINQELVRLTKDLYEDAQSRDGVVQIPRIRSFEQILFDAGWRFSWNTTGDDARLGAEMTQPLIEAVQNSYEFRLLAGGNPDIANALATVVPLVSEPTPSLTLSDEHSFYTPTPETEQSLQGGTIGAEGAVLAKLETLTAAVGSLVEALTKQSDDGESHSSGGAKPRAKRGSRKGPGKRVSDADARRAGTRVSKPRKKKDSE
ncbi:MAG: hypothetical protein E6Q97_16185 [Desulfurellales bacterium]|nr:MAG: hypothetical protein E6Q97_16185 [Desulfurellales bacterium]